MSESSRPTRKRRLPAKYQGGATAGEISGEQAIEAILRHTNPPTPPPPTTTTMPPISPQQPRIKRGRKLQLRDTEPPVLFAIPVNGVFCLGWLDNDAVLSITTVHTVHEVSDITMRWRKRPGDISTNARQSRKPFEGRGARSEQPIPPYIDEYSYNMGGIDIAD